MKSILHTVRLFVLTMLVCMYTGAFAQKKPKLTEPQEIELQRLFLNASREKMLNNTEDAIREFKACLAIDPENAAVYYNLAELYLDKKLLGDAENYVQQAIALDKENLWYKRLLGEIYELRQEYEKAGEISLFLSTKEYEVQNLVEAAYFFALAKEYGKAIHALDKVEKIVGTNEEIIRQKEQIYLAMNKLPDAIREVEKLIAAYPKASRYRGMLAELYMANGKSEKAVQIYEQILAEEPGNGFAAFALSDYYKARGEYDKWYEMLKRGMASKDVDTKSKLTVMVGFITSKVFENTRERAKELVDLFETASPQESTVFLIRGDLLVEDGQYSAAHEAYRKAVAFEPAALVGWQQMVYCSARLLDNEMLKKDCEDALEYFPNEVMFHFYHAVASIQLKQYETAVASAEKGIQLSEDNKEMLISLYSSMGDAYHYLKNDSACDSAYEKALALDGDNAYALNNYAYFLSLRKSNLDKAERMSKKSLELDPDNASYFDTYGWIFYQKKEFEKAKEYIERSLQLAPNNAEVVEHLGDVLYQMGKKEQAVDQWKQAKTLGSEGAMLDRKIREGKLYE